MIHNIFNISMIKNIKIINIINIEDRILIKIMYTNTLI